MPYQSPSRDTAVPVWTPIRSGGSSPSSPICSEISRPSSRPSRGSSQRTIIASPIVLISSPRYRGSTRLTLANNRNATSAALSSPRSAVSAEKPTRSMNRKVCASLGIAGLAYR